MKMSNWAFNGEKRPTEKKSVRKGSQKGEVQYSRYVRLIELRSLEILSSSEISICSSSSLQFLFFPFRLLSSFTLSSYIPL